MRDRLSQVTAFRDGGHTLVPTVSPAICISRPAGPARARPGPQDSQTLPVRRESQLSRLPLRRHHHGEKERLRTLFQTEKSTKTTTTQISAIPIR